MVTVMRGGQEVKISKRAGSYVTLRDLIDWTSRDAVRFFLISRKADTEFVFDIDLALKANDENPVFYVQYAHARICSVLAQFAAAHGGDLGALAQADLSLLAAPTEYALMLKLADYPDMLSRAAAELAPHDLAFYLRELSAAFHSYYAAERFLVDDVALMRARMALLGATRQVLRNALSLLGRQRTRGHGARGHGDAGECAMKSQYGGFAVGLVVGLLLGLALALGVALYVTKVPLPFINKVPQRTAEQDAAEVERNRNWDPNAPLGGKPAGRAAASGAVSAAPAAPAPPARQGVGASRHRRRAGSLRRAARRAAAASKPLKPGADPMIYFAQAGAYTRADDAEAQRAKLALLGVDAKVSERDQSGRTIYRVRVGPFDARAQADTMLEKLQAAGVDSSLVRVERQ